jgi:hypothetical protein
MMDVDGGVGLVMYSSKDRRTMLVVKFSMKTKLFLEMLEIE